MTAYNLHSGVGDGLIFTRLDPINCSRTQGSIFSISNIPLKSNTDLQEHASDNLIKFIKIGD